MLTFLLAALFLVITPGPGVLSTAGVSAGYGARAGTRYVFGLWLGNNLVALMVITGLAALVLAEPRVRVILFALSFGYLTYIAAKIALAGSKIGFIEKSSAPTPMDAVILQIINPKAYTVNTAIFAGFPILPDAYGAEVAFKLIAFNAIWIPVHFLWLWAGISLNRLDLGPMGHRAINIAMAALMIGVVLLGVAVQFGWL